MLRVLPENGYSLDCLDGRENLQQFTDDEFTQRLKSLNGLSDKHKHVSGCQLILVAEELHQLRTKDN